MPTLRDRLAGLVGSRAVVRNVQWLFLEKSLRIVFAVLVGAWVARHLGPERFGVLSYVIAFVAIFQEVCQLGLDSIVVRDLAQRPGQAPGILGTALRLRFTASVIGFVLALLLAQALRPGDAESVVLTALVACGLLFQVANTVDLWFQSQLQSRRGVLAKTLAFTLANGARVVAILAGADLATFAALALAEGAVVALAMALMYRRFRTQSRWVWQPDIATTLLRESWPLLISGLAVLLYMRLDQIMLRELVGEHELGMYAAAQQLSTAGYFLPMIVCTSVAPDLARLHASAPREYLAALRRLFGICWALSLSVAAVVVLGADFFIHFLYGADFAEAATVLRWHVLAMVPVSLGIAQSLWIAHEKRPALALIRTLLGFGVSITLNFALIPRFGATGSAIAYLACQIVAAMLSNVLLAPHILRLQLSSLLPIRRFE